jgi:hypothetical protein
MKLLIMKFSPLPCYILLNTQFSDTLSLRSSLKHDTHRTTKAKTFKAETGSYVTVHTTSQLQSLANSSCQHETFRCGLSVATDPRYQSNKGPTAKRN